jgi:hypothetical protein
VASPGKSQEAAPLVDANCGSERPDYPCASRTNPELVAAALRRHDYRVGAGVPLTGAAVWMGVGE